jgi:rsbT co-antagonist protein RsbR
MTIDPHTLAVLSEENEALRKQVAALETALAEQRRLSQEAELARRIVDCMPAPMYVYDLDAQHHVYINRALFNMMGYTNEDVERLGTELLFTLMHPDDWTTFPDRVAQLQAAVDEQVLECDYRMRRSDGTWCWFGDQQVIFARNEDGSVRQCLGLVHDISVQKQTEADRELFQRLVEQAQDGIALARFDKTIIYANPAMRTMSGYGDAVIGTNFMNLYPPDVQEQLRRDALRTVHTVGHWRGVQSAVRPDGTRWMAQVSSFLIPGADNEPMFAAIFRDVTGEQERQMQEQIIAAQAAALRELSTPLIPLADGILAMPIVGAIDSMRAQQIMETLLEGIGRQQAEVAILDITGVKVVDTQVADALLRAAQAAKLLGAQVVLTGVGPEIAQTLIQIGANLDGLVTQRNLQNGIAYALTHRSKDSNTAGRLSV